VLIATVCLVAGCGSLLPSSDKYEKSGWGGFDSVMASYDKIEPGKTTTDQLIALGFDPSKTANVRSLNYLEVSSLFLHNPSITLADLAPEVRECLESGNGCRALLLELSRTRRERYGSVPLDVFGFRKYAKEDGWQFKALIVLDNDLVVHKIWSGSPNVSRVDKEKRPLGPLQDVDLGTALRRLD
jgi:hypothetical protein